MWLIINERVMNIWLNLTYAIRPHFGFVIIHVNFSPFIARKVNAEGFLVFCTIQYVPKTLT